MKTIFPMTTGQEDKLPFHITGIGVQENQEHIYRPSGFPHYHWAHCVAGEGKLLIAGVEYRIAEGMGFFFHPGTPHEYYAVKEPWTVHWLTFDGDGLQPLLNLLNIDKWCVFNLSSLNTIELIMNEIYLSLQSDSSLKVIECSSLLYHFLVKLKTCIDTGEERIRDTKLKQLWPVVSYMDKNYHRYTSVEEMASIIGVTSYHLCRLFKQSFGMSPFKYLTRLRIQKAKQILVESSELTISAVAKKVGYSDASYFCSVFKEHEGTTPMEFKKMHGVV